MIVTTTPSAGGRRTAARQGIVVGAAIRAAHIMRGLFAGAAGAFGGRSGTFGEEWATARAAAPGEMRRRARAPGADAVAGVGLDDELGNGMPMVPAPGTSVTLAE
ncbi:MAG: heavy metal-binding domain-containing protein [Rhodobacteraceae bacterium]|nr:heavy metal-binding domain-containing protein [Paracoccaceae bacterium]